MAENFFMKISQSRIPLYLRVSIALLVLLQLNSCYSPVDDCTDPEATNYLITADNLCEDCCTYPKMELSIFHENLDTTFKLKDTITNDIGQQISLLDYVYLLSGFQFMIGEESYEVIDSISLNVADGVQFEKDDVISVFRDEFTFELGTIIFNGNTTEMSFRTGLSDLLNENRFTTEQDDHPLTNNTDSLYQSDSGTYVFQRIQVAQGTEFLDTVIYDIEVAADISFPLDFASNRGEDKKVIIEAQYDRWFDGIDFGTMTKEEIESKIAQNTTNVFRQKN